MRGAGILCVLVVGLALAASGQALTGHWRLDLSIDPQAAAFVDAFDFSTEFLVKYSVADWTFSSLSQLDGTGWTDQDFSAIGVLGGFTISTALDFDPSAPAFQKWVTTTTVELAGVTFSGTFELYDEDTYLTLQGRGTSGDVGIVVTVKLGDDDDPGECDLDFSSLQIGVEFPFCCTQAKSTITFTCDGFQDVVFETFGITIQNLPWVTFDAKVTFTVQTKSLAITPRFDFSGACIEMYVGVETSGTLTLEALHFDGFILECDLGDIRFTAISFWGDFVPKPSILGDYWEMYKIEADEDACCGPFDFEAAVFFDEASSHLFDVGMFTFDMSLAVAATMKFSIGLDLVLGTGVTSIDFGFLITW